MHPTWNSCPHLVAVGELHQENRAFQRRHPLRRVTVHVNKPRQQLQHLLLQPPVPGVKALPELSVDDDEKKHAHEDGEEPKGGC